MRGFAAHMFAATARKRTAALSATILASATSKTTRATRPSGIGLRRAHDPSPERERAGSIARGLSTKTPRWRLGL